MREHGSIDSGGGLGDDGHACWTFDQGSDFAAAALEFLADGLRAGQRLAYVGSETAAEQRERLDPLGDVGSMIDTGMLQLFQLEDLYAVGKPIDCDAQLATYAAATDAALADGYTGLRVAAQVTDLVADPGTWEAQVRWESVADRFMSVRPLSALCGYRRDALPDHLLCDLAAVHPAANAAPGGPPFHLFGETGDLVLSGEVDCFSAAALDRVLEAALDRDPASLDLGELDFIDHHGLETLAAHTRRLAKSGGAVHNAPPVVDRLCELLELTL
ncbi:MAG: MEDS domain-containing protein [Solirubrobacterales bacterium]